MRRKIRGLVLAAGTILGVVALTAVVIAVDGGGSTCGSEEDTAARLRVLALARDSFDLLLEDSAAAAADGETSVTTALTGHGLDADGNNVSYEFDPALTSLAIVEDHLAALEDCPVPDQV